ncbi:MAG: hypothetical protein COV45_02480 [Deltaproteobacteria bacterium CG11_big_fil_rev_8_21_14_0_20_47_16]|nr:MAG: hypothetical protein COV45_02480 [Deltaproteobacteria bacterium CG11_big_fil_rev_8_21_14_0_20_47_16]
MSCVIGEPIWKDAPRFCGDLQFPSYRYLPGKNLHPDEGHLPQLTEHNAFRYGVDLYHAGYFYEAHEAWESLWLKLPKEDLERTLLHGLIQLTAALLKLELKQIPPAQRLSRRALHYVEIVQHHTTRMMGLDVPQLAQHMQRYFQPLWASAKLPPKMSISRAPKLNLV